MSLGVVIKGPEGLVLAADSRVTLEARQGNNPPISVHFDNSTKLLSFNGHSHVGAVTYGTAVIGSRTAHSYIPEFENKLTGEDQLSVEEFAQKLSKFFSERWNDIPRQQQPAGADMTFIVGGYNEGKPYGEVYLFSIPSQPKPEPRNSGVNEFGMTWGGQIQLASRLIHGYDPGLVQVLKNELKLPDETLVKIENTLKKLQFPIPYQVLPLQDCVNLATLLIRTTISAQSVSVGVRGVGGPIDIATITRTDGLQSVQAKKIQGEQL